MISITDYSIFYKLTIIMIRVNNYVLKLNMYNEFFFLCWNWNHREIMFSKKKKNIKDFNDCDFN